MKQSILLITTLALLAGCSQEAALSPEGGQYTGKATPLAVDDIVLESVVATRAATELTTDNAMIGIFCSKGTGYDAAQLNIPYKYTAGSTNKWAPNVSTSPVWLLAGNADVCAYYPYKSGNTNSAAIPLTSGVYTAAGDICFAPNRAMNGTPSKSKTAFAMQRAMAKMVFTLKKGDYPGTCTVSNIQLANTNLPATGSIDITAMDNTAATLTKASLSYTPLSTGSTTLPSGGTGVATQDILLVPFILSGDFTVTLTVDGKDMQIKLPAATFTNSKIQAGRRYLLTLKLNGTVPELTNVTVEEWTDVPMTDGGKDYEPFPAS